MRRRRQLHLDAIAGTNDPAAQDNAHHASPAHDTRVGALDKVRAQSGLELVDLAAGIAQAGELDDGLGTNVKPRALRQAKQIEIAGGDVLPPLARPYSCPLARTSSSSSEWIRCTWRRLGCWPNRLM